MDRHLPQKLTLLGLLCLLTTSGCERGPAMGIVDGEVTLDGQPLANGAITFEPVAGDTPTAGATIENGRFTAQVPVTKHRVRINTSKPTGKKVKAFDTPDSPVSDELVEIIPARYNLNTTLSIEVKSGRQDVRFEVKSR